MTELLTELWVFLGNVSRLAWTIVFAIVLGAGYYNWTIEKKAEGVKRTEIEKAEKRKKAAAEADARAAESLRIAEAQREQAERNEVDEKRTQLQEMLYAQVYDQYSVRLRNVRMIRSNGGYVLCGNISAKVASGKYFPERAFAVTELPLDKAPSQVIGISKSGEVADPAATASLISAAGCE